MSRADIEEGNFMIRTIERAKTHYEVFQLEKDADAKTIRTTMRRAPRRNQLQRATRHRRDVGSMIASAR